MLTAYLLDQQGGALVDVFASYVAGLQADDAVKFWQQQLFAEKVANEMRMEAGQVDGRCDSTWARRGASDSRSFPSNSREGTK
eukprot:16441544-Heterocapsa_arctica.AAC.1